MTLFISIYALLDEICTWLLCVFTRKVRDCKKRCCGYGVKCKAFIYQNSSSAGKMCLLYSDTIVREDLTTRYASIYSTYIKF